MTREETEKKIKELEERLATVKDAKRRTFLKATINRYSKSIGKPEPYKWQGEKGEKK